MNFQQLRSIREAVRYRFNLTDAAEAMHTSQPGVSRQIRELEEELGIELFVRAGKRLTGLTEPGAHVLPIIERLLLDANNLKKASHDFTAQQSGTLSIAATHSQARYALPAAVQEFCQRFPDVRLNMHQGSPDQVAQMLLAGDADIAIATEALNEYDELIALPSYRWTHSVIVPKGHALTQLSGALSLEDLVKYPLITYDNGFTGRRRIDDAFGKRQLSPNIMLSAMDADVIKTYVELGLGVGIVASIAYENERDKALEAIDAGSLFGINHTKIAIRRGAYLRGFTYAFIEAFAPMLTREMVEKAMAHDATNSKETWDI